MAEQNTPKLVQDAAEPAPVAPPTPGLDAPMRATAERLVAEAAEAAPKPEPPAPAAPPPPPPPPQPSPPPARRPPRACRSRSNITDSGLDDAMPLAAAADLIKDAKKIVVVSGSGISAAAGLSTYVGGKDGLYEKARKRYKLEKGIDLFGWRFYSERPRDAQKFLAELAVAVQKAQPTPTHRALVDLERSGVLMRHITLNIDGLHAQAGASLWDGSDGATVELVYTAGTAYVRAPAAFWASFGMPAEFAGQLEGQWVLLPAEAAGSFSTLTLSGLAQELRASGGSDITGEVTSDELDGEPVVVVTQDDGSTLTVADDEQAPYPLLIEDRGDAPATVRFSEFGETVEITAPENPVDLNTLGG